MTVKITEDLHNKLLDSLNKLNKFGKTGSLIYLLGKDIDNICVDFVLLEGCDKYVRNVHGDLIGCGYVPYMPVSTVTNGYLELAKKDLQLGAFVNVAIHEKFWESDYSGKGPEQLPYVPFINYSIFYTFPRGIYSDKQGKYKDIKIEIK
jgi:hypothetical protein